MTTAVIPMKPLAQAKSRLASALPGDVRHELVRLMLQDVLAACHASSGIKAISVVTADTSLREMVEACGADLFPERGATGLNEAVSAAQAQIAPGAMLYMAGDLPLVTPADIEAMIDATGDGIHSVIAPSCDRNGTNALLLSQANLVAPEFGENSFERHLAALETIGPKARIVERRTLGLDIDRPEDLETLLSQRPDDGRYDFIRPYVLARRRGSAATGQIEVGRHA